MPDNKPTTPNKRPRKDLPPIPREAGENEAWYSRVCSYILAGPGRSVLAVFNGERSEKDRQGQSSKPATSLSAGWRKMIDRFHWRERAGRFDLELIELEKTRFSEDRESERRKRFALLRRLRRKISVMLVLFNPNANACSIRDIASIASAFRSLSDVSREDFEMDELRGMFEEIKRGQKTPQEDQGEFARRMRAKLGGKNHANEA